MISTQLYTFWCESKTFDLIISTLLGTPVSKQEVSTKTNKVWGLFPDTKSHRPNSSLSHLFYNLIASVFFRLLTYHLFISYWSFLLILMNCVNIIFYYNLCLRENNNIILYFNLCLKNNFVHLSHWFIVCLKMVWKEKWLYGDESCFMLRFSATHRKNNVQFKANI